MEPVTASWTACFIRDLLHLSSARWFARELQRLVSLCRKRVMDRLNDKASVLKKKSDNSKGKQSQVRFYI